MANEYFLVHASGPPTEALIEMAKPLAPIRGARNGAVRAA